MSQAVLIVHLLSRAVEVNLVKLSQWEAKVYFKEIHTNTKWKNIFARLSI